MTEKKGAASKKKCSAYIVVGGKRYPCIRIPQAHDKGNVIAHTSNVFTSGNKVAFITFGYVDGRDAR